jgi:hypothetical protein
MADTVTTRVLSSGALHHAAVFTNISDGTGEASVVKVDRSTLANLSGQAPAALTILDVQWSIQGFSSVAIAFDHNADDVVLVLGAGTGRMKFAGLGGIKDPGSAGATGSLVFTTRGGSAGASYTIALRIKQ